MLRLHPGGQKGARTVDKLVEVRQKDGSDVAVYVHIEVQGQQQKEFARRMFVYHYRIFDRYSGEVMSLAVLTDSRPSWRPDQFENYVMGCQVYLQYPVAKLLDFRDRMDELERSDNPFAIVVLAHLSALATRRNHQQRLDRKLAIIRGLNDREWSKADIRKLFDFIDGLMTHPDALDEQFQAGMTTIEKETDMAIVTSLERLGMKKGREEGRQEGGLRMARQNVMDALEVRFGSVPPEIRKGVEALVETDSCRDLLRIAITAASIKDFETELVKVRR